MNIIQFVTSMTVWKQAAKMFLKNIQFHLYNPTREGKDAENFKGETILKVTLLRFPGQLEDRADTNTLVASNTTFKLLVLLSNIYSTI